jgi:hypothetical protein
MFFGLMYIWMIRHVCFVRPYQDTALKIDSSDEEEAVNDTGSAMKPREQRCQSDLQCSVKMYLKFLSLDACSSLYCTFLSAFSVVNPLEYYRTVYIVQVLDHGMECDNTTSTGLFCDSISILFQCINCIEFN